MFILKHVKTRMCPNTLTQDIDTPFVQGEQFKNTMWLSTGICKIFITHLFPGPSFKIEKMYITATYFICKNIYIKVISISVV